MGQVLIINKNKLIAMETRRRQKIGGFAIFILGLSFTL
ncbi:hypothetical protein LEP1GSC172_3154 [Leptospira noguchii]|uniref:Uncharacterized protein n=2 Tax=Leptospira noguchii TaxID=28182 RepID=T0GXY0_9LEPT|nr:hypothetical protein LEP1GSC172_3154 [Leptospira noguchii]EQA73807.1 hypothetical protein LEP1GSC059_3821 [Leptospira noguchii serovar Panama str. CZ214]